MTTNYFSEEFILHICFTWCYFSRSFAVQS